MKRYTLLLVLLLVVVCSGFGADRELFREAEGRYKSGNYAAALDLYSRFLSENRISPDAPDAQFKMAVCLYQLGRFQESLDRFSKIAKSYSSTNYLKMVPFWQGRISLELNDYKSAAAYLDEYIRLGDADIVPEAYLYRAMSFEKLGRVEDAAYSLELMLNRNNYTDDGYITSLLSSIYLKQGKYESILKISTVDADSSFKPEYRNRMLLYKAEALYMTEKLDAAEKITVNFHSWTIQE
jgi:tetratricopeptide (TPR) repeat protein